MAFDYLKNHYREYLQHMEEHGYCEVYISLHRTVLNFILNNANQRGWESYDDVYNAYCSKCASKGQLSKYVSVLDTLKQFETNHVYPVRSNRRPKKENSKYDLLAVDFKTLITDYEREYRKKGITESTINSVRKTGISFLFAMQERGCMTISSITDKDVLSYFLTDEGEIRCGYATSTFLQRLFRICLSCGHDGCATVLTYLPKFPKSKKNIQYLKEDEINRIREVMDDPNSNLTLRDRAVCMTLMFTGLRRGDVAGLKLNDIDWETDTIRICQEKTEAPVRIPLIPVLGNAIYDYIKSERPDAGDENIFLSTSYSTPGNQITGSAVSGIARKVFDAAGIRQNPGDKKNPHLFRHHMAVTMLGNGIPQPVISHTLGHASPVSTESYLSADFVNLKKCALSIEAFPVPKEVFE